MPAGKQIAPFDHFCAPPPILARIVTLIVVVTVIDRKWSVLGLELGIALGLGLELCTLLRPRNPRTRI